MLMITEILEALQRLPEEFEQHRAVGKICAAAMVYEKAVIVSYFIQMEPEPRERLLSRFDPEAVQEVYKAAGWWEEGELDAYRTGDRKEVV